MRRSLLAVLAVAASMSVAHAQTTPDLGAMLGQAQHYTVKVRGTVNWPFAPEMMGTGLGTGFIIDREKGWILTNAHVARRSPAAVEITFGDAESEWIGAERLYVDNHMDIAVLKVAPDKLPPDATAATLGCDKAVKQGETVVAYGHPINLNFTATRGIVSSIRTLGTQEYVQMDANINPGNSGGPLLAAETAQVIGINTLNLPGAPGLGFAVSIRHVCPIIALLKKGEDAGLPLLPVYWLKHGPVDTLTVADRFPAAAVAAIAGANDTSDASIKAGDVVQGLAGGGVKIDSVADLYQALRGHHGTIDLSVLRDGNATTVHVPLLPAQSPLKRQGLTLAGMLITERVTQDTYGLAGLPQLRIDFVKVGEAAQRAGFIPGDLLDRVGGQRFSTIKALYEWVKARPTTEKITIMVRRASFADPRLSAEYRRFDVLPLDFKLLTGASES